MSNQNESKASSHEPTEAAFESGKRTEQHTGKENAGTFPKDRLIGVVVGGVVTIVAGALIVGFIVPIPDQNNNDKLEPPTPKVGLMEIPYDKNLSVEQNLENAKAAVAKGDFSNIKVQEDGKWIPVAITPQPAPVNNIVNNGEKKEPVHVGKENHNKENKLKDQLKKVEELEKQKEEELKKAEALAKQKDEKIKELQEKNKGLKEEIKDTANSDEKNRLDKHVKHGKDPHHNDAKIAKIVSDGKGGHYAYFIKYENNDIKIWVDKDGDGEWKHIKHTTPTATIKETDNIYHKKFLGMGNHHDHIPAGHDKIDIENNEKLSPETIEEKSNTGDKDENKDNLTKDKVDTKESKQELTKTMASSSHADGGHSHDTFEKIGEQNSEDEDTANNNHPHDDGHDLLS